MRITPDSNVLIRALINDDPTQGRRARDILQSADGIAITLPTLCEFVWVLRTFFKKSAADVSVSIRAIVDGDTANVDLPAVEAGLHALASGADFADGVIAFDGQRLGGEVFVTFDRKAARQIAATGAPVQLL